MIGIQYYLILPLIKFSKDFVTGQIFLRLRLVCVYVFGTCNSKLLICNFPKILPLITFSNDFETGLNSPKISPRVYICK